MNDCLAGLIFGGIVGLTVGCGVMGAVKESCWRTMMVEKGYAYYHPQTAEFTWKNEDVVRTQDR